MLVGEIMRINENIYNLRKKNGLSQEDLAEQIKVARQTISNWELGETSPNTEQLVLLAKAFNISVDELIGYKAKSKLKESKFNISFSILILVLVGAIVCLLILLFREKDKNTIKFHLTTKSTTTMTSKFKDTDTFIRTYEIVNIEKVICDGKKSGCDDTTFNVTLKVCNKESVSLQISNSEEFKKLKKGKTYEFTFKPMVGEVYYEDNITNIFAFNGVVNVNEVNKKCASQIQDKIKTRSE